MWLSWRSVEANQHANTKPVDGNTYGVKQVVVGMKSRTTNQVKAAALQTVSAKTITFLETAFRVKMAELLK